MKKILFGYIFFLFTLILNTCYLVPTVSAAEDFSSSYKINYSVDNEGVTEVTEQVTLKNLTDNLYAQTFAITIYADQVTEVSAFDKSGPLDAKLIQKGSNTQILVTFKQQIVGRDKEYPFTLQFKSKDFSQKVGNSWEIAIPKLNASNIVNNLELTLTVPANFGDPTSIIPEPKRSTGGGSSLTYLFDKEQVINSGVQAVFGKNQIFLFDIKYRLENDSIFPKVLSIPLPNNTIFQQSTIESISPKPDNITIDKEGNYLAWFTLQPKQIITPSASGSAKLFTKPIGSPAKLSAEKQKEYLLSTKYWDKDNPIIKAQLEEILRDKNVSTPTKKASAINDFVVNTLVFDKSKKERLDGVTVLKNPDNVSALAFSDLFVTLAKAAGIPSRIVVGTSIIGDNALKPLSESNNFIHVWPEYYEESKGWVRIDPTWQNTSGGINYFSNFDLDHFALLTLSNEDNLPIVEEVKIISLDEELFLSPEIEVVLLSGREVFSGFPSTLRFRIENKGNFIQEGATVKVFAKNLKIINSEKIPTSSFAFTLPPLPPKGFLEYSFTAHSGSLLDSYNDSLTVEVNNRPFVFEIEAKPLLSYPVFIGAAVGSVILIISLYTLVLTLHIKTHRKLSKKK